MRSYDNMKMYTSYLKGCYQHIFDRTPISAWGYLYFDLNGRYLQLMSDKTLIDLFFKYDLYTDQIIDSVSNDHGNYYTSIVQYDTVISNTIKEILIDNKYSYFFDLINKQQDFTEIYTFASYQDPHCAGNFFLNNLEILKIISQDLGKRCHKLLTKDNTMVLPKDFLIQMNELAGAPKNTKYVELKEIILEDKSAIAKSSLEDIKNDNVFDLNLLPFNFIAHKELTHKEKEIIYLYYFGFNFYRMADILEISKRTVDKHFENIKRKLNCESTGQIIPHLLRSNIDINNFIK